MQWLNKLKGKLKNFRQAWNSADDNRTFSMSQIMELFSSSYSADTGSDLGEIVFFTCLKILSESIGKIPCYLLDKDKKRITEHATTWLLSVKPNEFMTPAQFFTYLEFNRNYRGNAYVYINRPNGKIEGLYPLDSRCVQIWINNSPRFTERSYYYQYTDERNGKIYFFKPEEILHFKSWLTDDSGLAGKSVRETLATSFAGAKASTKFLNELYSKGLVASAFVKYTGDLKRESQDRILDEIIRQSNEKGRRLFTLPIGFDVQKLDLKLTDSQFFELKKYSALQIAAAFGIQPAQLNDLTKSSYASEAAQQVSFLSSTLLYIITNYEQELNCKLLDRQEILNGLHFKFNVSVLLRTDPTAQADIIQKLVQNSVYSINEARYLLDREPCENGDTRIVNGSFVSLENIGMAYESKGGDENVESKE